MTAMLQALEREPLAAIRLDDVRRDAGVSVGALYHHFPDKTALADALYVELIATIHEQFLAELGAHPDAAGGVRGVVHWYLRWVSHNRAGARLLFEHRPLGNGPLEQLTRSFLAQTRVWWRAHAHYGSVRDLPLDLVYAIWLGPAESYTRQWLAGTARRVPRAAADALADTAWAALKGP